MKVIVAGTRGIPDISGGIESHCEELYPRIVAFGFDIVLIRRSCYISDEDELKDYKGIKLITLWAPRIKSIEAFLHTFLAVLWAKKHKASLIHIHAIGPALLIPFARLLGLKVVFTHHGPDYNRAKWGRFAKFMLRVGERFGTVYANEVIVISKVIQESLSRKYKRNNTHLIFNGVNIPENTNNDDFIKSLGLEPRSYVFTLGRFVEEKGFDLLINSFRKISKKDIKLVIAGDADHQTNYSKKLKKMANVNNVILTGFIKGEQLQQLFSNARLFVLPSYHEGLPISLLEAMSYRMPVLVSDIPANKQIALTENRFFITGNEESLTRMLNLHLQINFRQVDYDMAPYNWNQIAMQTKTVYEKVMK